MIINEKKMAQLAINKSLLKEYHEVLGDGPFEDLLQDQQDRIEALSDEAKAAVETA